jgi:mRNA interferase MazF
VIKDFKTWHDIKTEINDSPRLPSYSEREIWWCSIGTNVGHEEDGKGLYSRRPVLIVKKFNQHVFWGVPLTTQIKDKHYYHRISFKGVEQCVMLSQLRLWESKRLNARMGKLESEQFNPIREKLKSML